MRLAGYLRGLAVGGAIGLAAGAMLLVSPVVSGARGAEKVEFSSSAPSIVAKAQAQQQGAVQTKAAPSARSTPGHDRSTTVAHPDVQPAAAATRTAAQANKLSVRVASMLKLRRNTGVDPSLRLTTVSGDLVVSRQGAKIARKRILGRVIVRASDVSISDSEVLGRTTGSEGALIEIAPTAKHTAIVRTSVHATHLSPRVGGVMGAHFTLDRVDIWDVVDQVYVVGGGVSVTESWLHDNSHFAYDPERGGPTHDDNVQIESGSNVTVTGSVLTGAWNSAVMITQDAGPTSHVSVRGNYLCNGGCTVNITRGVRAPLRGLVLSDNVFNGRSKLANCEVVAPPGTGITLKQNVLVDGKRVSLY